MGIEKRRFEDAQVGDEVNCELWGDGVINKIDNTSYPIDVLINDRRISYTVEGKLFSEHLKPTLTYRKGEIRGLTERPKRMVKKVADFWFNIYKQTYSFDNIYSPSIYLCEADADKNKRCDRLGKAHHIIHEYEAEE